MTAATRLGGTSKETESAGLLDALIKSGEAVMKLAMDSHPLAHEGGWTVRRREVINDAAGICARCGMAGADTATRGWDGEDVVAAHTRCVVGLGPPTATTAGSGGLLAA